MQAKRASKYPVGAASAANASTCDHHGSQLRRTRLKPRPPQRHRASRKGFSGFPKGTSLIWLLVGISLGAQANDEDVPSLELLEYLGTLVEANGEFVGPEDLTEDTLFQRVAGAADPAPRSSEEEVIE